MILKNTFFFSGIVALVSTSKCPESRKPHATSCKIFYNCINLPEGGYVWAPAKCANGLVFQPYLRMCVLPGDSWTCDTLLTESPFVTYKYETPELIDTSQTRYASYTENPFDYSETVDSSYPTDDISGELSQLQETPYPLIVINEPTTETSIDNNAETNPPILIERMEEKILYDFLRKITPIEISQSNKTSVTQDYYAQLMGQLIFRNISISSEKVQPTSSLILNANDTNKTAENLSIQKNSVLLNYLLRNYTKEKDLENIVVTAVKFPNQSGIKDNIDSPTVEATTMKSLQSLYNTFQMLTDHVNAENNIIMIRGATSEKQYLTLERYKALANQLNALTVKIIPCTKNTRLANDTDCRMYYTCDPKSALVKDYRCPLGTAFNKYTRLCDTQSYVTCPASVENTDMQIQEMQMLSSQGDNLRFSEPKDETCKAIGKTGDPVSDTHYYICYNSPHSGTKVKSVRMSCPNGLIFCQNKKVCTTKELCKM